MAALDVEGMQIDIAEAIGKATAATALQGAMVAVLVSKGLMTLADAADITATATAGLAIFRLPADAEEMAKAAIRGFAASVAQNVTQH